MKKKIKVLTKPLHLKFLTFVLVLNYIFSIISIPLTIFSYLIGLAFIPSWPISIRDGVIVAAMLPLLLGTTVLPYFIISKSLYSLFKSIEDGKPFEKSNGIKIRVIGFTFLVTAILLFLYHSVFIPIYNHNVVTPSDIDNQNVFINQQYGMTFIEPQPIAEPETPFFLFVISLMMFTISEVFIQGAKMKEENELTV